MLRYLDNYRYALHPTQGPLYLIHFLTDRCQLFCRHCFFRDRLGNDERTLPMARLRRIIRSLSKPLDQVVLTGGETFLKKGLPHICSLYSRDNHCREIVITSNGLASERIVEQTGEILAKTDCTINIQLSLDGNQDCHDTLRGRTGSYAAVIKTIEQLRILERRIRPFTIKLLFVVMQGNKDDFEQVIDLADRLELELAFEFLRKKTGPARDSLNTTIDPSGDEFVQPLDGVGYLEFIENLDQYRKQKALRSKSLHYSMMIADQTIPILRGTKKTIACQAGRLIGVLYPDGRVAPCENHRLVFDLARYNDDFGMLWKDLADEVKKLGNNCVCTHGCFVWLDILYHPIRLFRLLEKYRMD